MAIYLSNRDGGKTDEQGHYKFQTNAFTGNVLDGGLLVTQNSPLAMNVKVSGGDARIPYSDYAYTAWIPAGAPETVTVTTANPSNPRIDRLVMYVDRGATPSSATANNPTLCKLMLVAGTPAGSPSRPSNGTVDTAVSNNPYIDLADIRVNAGVTQITDADITDTRVLVGAPIADGSVTTAKVADGSVTNEKLKTGAGEPGGAWDTWTPTWSNVTIGNAVVTARYKQVGKTVTCRLSVALGSTTTTSGDIIFSLPVPSIAYPGVSGLHPIGTSRYFDVSASVVYIGDVENISTTTSSSRFFSNAGSYSGQILNTGGLPIVWGNGDQWAMSFTYEAA